MSTSIGTLVAIDADDNEVRSGVVSIHGVSIRVPLNLVPDAVKGDLVLVESGVAVAIVRHKSKGETTDVPGHSR